MAHGGLYGTGKTMGKKPMKKKSGMSYDKGYSKGMSYPKAFTDPKDAAYKSAIKDGYSKGM